MAWISTSRLRLRPIELADKERVHLLYLDELANQQDPQGGHPDRGFSGGFVEDVVEDWTRDGLGYWAAFAAALVEITQPIVPGKPGNRTQPIRPRERGEPEPCEPEPCEPEPCESEPGKPVVLEFVGVGGVRRAGYTRLDGVYRADGEWNVYYRIASAWWGHGYAGSIVRAAAREVEQIAPGALLTARIRPANLASQRVALKLGMRLLATGADHTGEPELIYQAPAARIAN